MMNLALSPTWRLQETYVERDKLIIQIITFAGHFWKCHLSFSEVRKFSKVSNFAMAFLEMTPI